MLDELAALERYQADIARFTHYCPRFWRRDVAQELRMTVIETYRRLNGIVDDNSMRLELLEKLYEFAGHEYRDSQLYINERELPIKARRHLEEIKRQKAIVAGQVKKARPKVVGPERVKTSD